MRSNNNSTSCSIPHPRPVSGHSFTLPSHLALQILGYSPQYIGTLKESNAPRTTSTSEHSFYHLCFLSVPFLSFCLVDTPWSNWPPYSSNSRCRVSRLEPFFVSLRPLTSIYGSVSLCFLFCCLEPRCLGLCNNSLLVQTNCAITK